MLYVLVIMTTTGINWCMDGIPEIFTFCLKRCFYQKLRTFNFCLKMLSTLLQMQNCKPHPNLSTQTRDMIFYILSLERVALSNRKVQNGIDKIYHLHFTDGQNEIRFSFLFFFIERGHFWQKIKFGFFGRTKNTFFHKNHRFLVFYQNINLILS